MEGFSGCFLTVYYLNRNIADDVLSSHVSRAVLSLVVEVSRSRNHSLSAVLSCFLARERGIRRHILISIDDQI